MIRSLFQLNIYFRSIPCYYDRYFRTKILNIRLKKKNKLFSSILDGITRTSLGPTGFNIAKGSREEGR